MAGGSSVAGEEVVALSNNHAEVEAGRLIRELYIESEKSTYNPGDWNLFRRSFWSFLRVFEGERESCFRGKAGGLRLVVCLYAH